MKCLHHKLLKKIEIHEAIFHNHLFNNVYFIVFVPSYSNLLRKRRAVYMDAKCLAVALSLYDTTIRIHTTEI